MAEKIKKPEKPALFSKERFQREYYLKLQQDANGSNKSKVFSSIFQMKILMEPDDWANKHEYQTYPKEIH